MELKSPAFCHDAEGSREGVFSIRGFGEWEKLKCPFFLRKK